MKSPFPGMDPYLEGNWADVHARLTTYASDQLNRRLPPDLRARIHESLFVEATGPDGPEPATYFPDVQVKTAARTKRRPAPRGGKVATPILVPRAADPAERSVHIVATTGGRVVTAIEFLSPANKVGAVGRDEFRRKQDDFLAAGVNLVEVDLIRSGRHAMAYDPDRLPAAPSEAYAVCVVRGWKPRLAEVYPLPLRKRLPTIRVPLRKTDGDVPLSLQALIGAAYENGGYDSLDDTRPPIPDLDPDDAAWADALLKKAGRR